ncbi:MAG: heparan-alpha-glucosaminide N-acetyltransferase domain-containing protein [Bacteroidota bacterium]
MLKQPRLNSIDLLRGLVMVLMALDHVRDFFTETRIDPLDLTETSAALFLTRWITHYCAPVFVFLAGTGAFLSLSRGKSKSDLSKFLLSRGLWLVIVEFTLVRFGWLFNLDYTFTFGQVIWVIGWSMVVLSGLVFLSTRVIAAVGILMIVAHNALDGLTPEQFGSFDWLWQILHVRSIISLGVESVFIVAYPLIPWIGVMACGYAFGQIVRMEEGPRRKALLQIGLGATLAFIVIRAANLYGDPLLWSVQESPLFTFLSFINTTKYPASLLFLLMTLGPSIALLVPFEHAGGRIAQFFIVFGRVPFFFYILHIYLAHFLAFLVASATGHETWYMFANNAPWGWPEGFGFGLPVVYAVWVGVVLLLYPACNWYADLKRRSRHPLLSYL